ncbi:rho-associated protein kinase 1-like [Formica exsecta]|uniref:rho-associated protein kinase 1-like n=1 Tax=Formica exsecta TaxID=72781 RepID=UPI0011442978|nr:rho-associated protein kinase 1-like [Formica exsecta]
MQNISLNKCPTNIIENKVLQNIAECDINDDEVVTLQQQITELNKTIVNLEDAIQIKDTQLENTHREKGRLLAELKKQQRCNRNLKQQLDDERFFYQREKDHFIEEMQRYRTKHSGNMSKFQQQQHKELEQTENKRLKEELANKNEVIYNTCIKFLRMKHAKDTLRYKLDQLLHEHLLVIAEMMEKLDEARKELNLIVSEKFQEPLPLNKAKFLQVVQRNNRLMYENATLKVQIHQLTQNIEKLKSQMQRPKKINIDAKIIEKLSTQNSTRSTLINKTEKIALLSKLSQPIDYFEDAKVMSQLHYIDTRNVENYDFKKFQTERAQSAPGIVETSANSQQNR